MAQGSKASYSSKQKRMASHIESGAKRRGRSTKTAERIAWATVNKRTGGAKGKKSSRTKSGTRRKSTGSRSRKTASTRTRTRSRGRSRSKS
ncbi:MAG TPA: hypothetical protein VM029_05305 [Opitutaceae bacterium]|nr:hypothetical protein [Opitutaceae bacterium]